VVLGGRRRRASAPPGTRVAPEYRFRFSPQPQLVDYLFLAFTSSSTFGPTDTLLMARCAKVLMILQSSLSLIIFGGIVARAVGNLR
jgi:uncharacterized membrane protein